MIDTSFSEESVLSPRSMLNRASHFHPRGYNGRDPGLGEDTVPGGAAVLWDLTPAVL